MFDIYFLKCHNSLFAVKTLWPSHTSKGQCLISHRHCGTYGLFAEYKQPLAGWMDTASEEGSTGEETRPCKETLEQLTWGKHKSGEKICFPFPWAFWSAYVAQWPVHCWSKIPKYYKNKQHIQGITPLSSVTHRERVTSNISAWHAMMLDHTSWADIISCTQLRYEALCRYIITFSL